MHILMYDIISDYTQWTNSAVVWNRIAISDIQDEGFIEYNLFLYSYLSF